MGSELYWENDRAGASAGGEPWNAISKCRLYPKMTFPPTQWWAPGMGQWCAYVHPKGEFKTEACKAWHKYEVWKTHSSWTVPHWIPCIPLQRRYRKHHLIQPIGEGLWKRLKNVTNQESYFCEKEEKCHQKGSADNPIGLKITAVLADPSGNGRRARDVMPSAEGAPAEWSCWGMRKLA